MGKKMYIKNKYFYFKTYTRLNTFTPFHTLGRSHLLHNTVAATFITRWSFRCRTKSNQIIHHVVCRRCVRCPRAAKDIQVRGAVDRVI